MRSASQNGATTDDSVEGDELIEIVCAEAHFVSAVARTAHVDLQPGLLQERAFLEHFAFFGSTSEACRYWLSTTCFQPKEKNETKEEPVLSIAEADVRTKVRTQIA